MNVVIVGGGSSGWMTAATLSMCKYANVTVIESPNIPTVGVGESTIQGFVEWMNLVDIEPEKMMKDTDAIFKLAIRFENWSYPGSECFYPFGNHIINRENYDIWQKRRIFSPELHKSFADTFFSNMCLIRNNKMMKHSQFYKFNCHALHFDAAKFGPWLWENVCKPRNVKRIVANVTNIETDEIQGIKWLDLDDGQRIVADLFVDCTGFKSLLLEQSLKVPFRDYSNVLPNNMAWATHIPYNDKEKEMISFTNCATMKNGWVWHIPLWSKIGSGYVYSNRFTSDAEALDEFKQYLKNMGRDPETLEFKNIPMRNGAHEKVWDKNVVAIGLSAGFIEPLESTGLWFTHELAYSLLRVISRGAPLGQFDQDVFNKNFEMKWEQAVDFVALHYALSARRDTTYWGNVGATKYKIDPQFVHASYNFPERYYSNWPGINCIAHGFEYHFLDDTMLWMITYPKNIDLIKKQNQVHFETLEKYRETWMEEVKTADTFFKVLQKIHNE